MIERCVRNLQNNCSVPQSLQIMREIIVSFPQSTRAWFSRDPFRSEPRKQSNIIETLNKSFSLAPRLHRTHSSTSRRTRARPRRPCVSSSRL